MQGKRYLRAGVLAVLVATGVAWRYLAGFAFTVPLYVVNDWWFPLFLALPSGERVEVGPKSVVRTALPGAGEVLTFTSGDGKRCFRVRVEGGTSPVMA